MKYGPCLGAYLLSSVLLLASGCASTESTSTTTVTRQVHESEESKAPHFVHCVFFALKPEIRDDEIEEFIRDCYSLKAVPSVRKLECGRRDERMQRDVNITDYQIGLVVYFLYSRHHSRVRKAMAQTAR